MSFFSRCSVSRRTSLAVILGATLFLCAGNAHAAGSISLDWATYNPLSVLIKAKGMMEQEFAKDGIEIKWQQSSGSNVAITSLNSKAIDFGSTAGSAAIIGRTNGGEYKSIYLYSKPEWVALLTKKDSAIKTVADLKDKRIAATRGTDAQVFVIRALKTAGLTTKDVKIIFKQHADGMKDMESGDVDAWGALDPLQAQSELKGNGRAFFRQPDFCSYGVMNVREEFAKNNPEQVKRVLKVYEAARKMAKDNPAALQAAMVAATGLPDDVIALQLKRTDLSVSAIDATARTTFVESGKALQDSGVVMPEVDVAKTVDAMIDTSYFK